MWAHDAAKSMLDGEPNITLKLLNNSYNLSEHPLVFRMHQNGMYIVGVDRNPCSRVYIIPDSQVIMANITPHSI